MARRRVLGSLALTALAGWSVLTPTGFARTGEVRLRVSDIAESDRVQVEVDLWSPDQSHVAAQRDARSKAPDPR